MTIRDAVAWLKMRKGVTWHDEHDEKDHEAAWVLAMAYIAEHKEGIPCDES